MRGRPRHGRGPRPAADPTQPRTLEDLLGDRVAPCIWLGPRPGGPEWNNADMQEFLFAYGWQLWTEPERLPSNYRNLPMFRADHAKYDTAYTLWGAVSEELERV